MTNGELDRYLAGEPPIVPSSGFAANVMDAVRREAATPPPIPFPWKRAIPGFVGALLIVVCFAVVFATTPITGAVPALFPRAAEILDAARAIGAGWILLALLLSYLSVRLAKLVARAPW